MIVDSIKRITVDLEITDETKELVECLSMVFLRDVKGGILLYERLETHLEQLRADLDELRKVRELRRGR